MGMEWRERSGEKEVERERFGEGIERKNGGWGRYTRLYTERGVSGYSGEKRAGSKAESDSEMDLHAHARRQRERERRESESKGHMRVAELMGDRHREAYTRTQTERCECVDFVEREERIAREREMDQETYIDMHTGGRDA